MIAGVFVGGRGSRMNNAAKGLLLIEGRTIIDRWRDMLESRSIPLVLVGVRIEYTTLGLPVVPDLVDNCGPMGGLAALLAAGGNEPVLVLGCDMPFVTTTMLDKLIAHSSKGAAVAPLVLGRWEPFFSRVPQTARGAVEHQLAGRQLSLQRLFSSLNAEPLGLDSAEEACLRDWDRPEDMCL